MSSVLKFGQQDISFTLVSGKKKLYSTLNITNTSNLAVIYKIKTTSQHRYAVKPNDGCIGCEKSKNLTELMIKFIKEIFIFFHYQYRIKFYYSMQYYYAYS